MVQLTAENSLGLAIFAYIVSAFCSREDRDYNHLSMQFPSKVLPCRNGDNKSGLTNGTL